MRILAFDTETTGKWKFKMPLAWPGQPRCVQLAAILYADETEVLSINTLVQPWGWQIPAEATAVHGITTERAAAEGLPLPAVWAIFDELLGLADLVVGHNLDFDVRIMEHEQFLLEGVHNEIVTPRCDTMLEMTDICRLPGRWPGSSFKWPKLSEAYQHAFGVELIGAHDALVDVRASVRIFRWLQARKAAGVRPDEKGVL